MDNNHTPQDIFLSKLDEALQKTIDRQIKEKEPPEVHQTIVRLKKEGFTEKKIRAMIAKLIVKHFQKITKEDFSYQEYCKDLQNLPDFSTSDTDS